MLFYYLEEGDSMKEIWKDIPGYEGLYQASNLGIIKSLKRIAKKEYNNNRIVHERIMNGTKNAEAEKEYKIAVNKKALELRSQDTPVTLINQIIYGIPAVAEKRFKRDVAETMYNTNLEHINVTKLKLRLLEAQLNREYGSSGKGDL